MNLFVDDERPAPDGWYRLANVEGTLWLLSALCGIGERVEALSLDYDLNTVTDGDAREIMLWMVDNDWWPEELYIHTANEDGEEWLVNMARQYAPAGVFVGYGINFWGTTNESREQHWENP